MASDSEDHSDLSSNYSDYSSDEGEQTLEQQPGCDSATPSQPATSNRSPASAPIVPRLGVPSLVLGSRNADRSGAGAMMTARPGTTPPPPAEQPKQPPAVVHLVSFAFTLDTPPSSNADLHAVRTRCVEAFGVAPEELTLFDLRTMGGAGAPAIGVAINNSSMFCRRPMRGYTPAHTGFSLEAMEQLLANNQQLSSAAERSAWGWGVFKMLLLVVVSHHMLLPTYVFTTGAAALESLQHLVREQHATVGKAQLLAAEKDAETRRLQERVRHLEKEVGALRCV